VNSQNETRKHVTFRT